MRAATFVLLFMCFPAAVSAQQYNAVLYDGKIYVSLDTLTKILDAQTRLTKWARGIRVQVKDRVWEFANGGDQIKLPSGERTPLSRPLLVIDGACYVPLHHCAAAFGCKVKNGSKIRLIHEDNQVEIRPRQIDPQYRRHRVTDFQILHKPVVTTDRIAARRSLHDKREFSSLCAGKTLLVRRSVTIDSKRCLLVTDAGPEMQSYLVATQQLEDSSKPADLDHTAWERYSTWFRERATRGRALRFGKRDRLQNNVAITIDLCWSLRKFEGDFFRSLPLLSHERGHDVHAVVFVSGRWLEQHPTEMTSLVELDQQPGVQLTWGLHSWAHPKSGGFMNDFSPERLRDDTLRLERSLLQWGIVPTVYYRFPGLIHDRKRLEEVLRLDLFPVDCGSWIALLGSSHPYANPVTDGSIILVHGNGNEPKGIQRLNGWLADHPRWQTRPLHDFFVPADNSADAQD